MAGAGAKLFTSGSVLTADQVNTFLMDQTIMRFTSTTTRDAAFGGAGEPTLSEGMFAYTSDTDTLWYYTGSVWQAVLGSNIGTISTSNRNKIINGGFDINQRGFTSATASGAFTFDRWVTELSAAGGTATYSAQTFTAGTAPVAGYEGTNFVRCVTASMPATNYVILQQKIEDVRTFANQTVTVSFWAKAASGTPLVGFNFLQNFGSGGSTSITTQVGTVTVSTSWARYSLTVTVPSIAGKTIGAGSNLAGYLVFSSNGIIASGVPTQNNTFDIWGVQVEAGSVATPFETEDVGTTLAKCQRYFYAFTSSTNGLPGFCDSTTVARAYIVFPTTMRTSPTLTATGSDFEVRRAGVTSSAGTSIVGSLRLDGAAIDLTVASGLTAGAGIGIASASGVKTMQFSAEL